MAGKSTDDFRKFFKAADKDGSGSLSFSEVTEIFKKQGYRDNEIKNFFRSVDASGDGQISEQEFLEAMGCVPPQQQQGAAMRSVFRDFDKDGNGKIEKAELQAVFKEMGKHFPDDQLKRMIELMDADKSGSVDYEEFIKYFTGK